MNFYSYCTGDPESTDMVLLLCCEKTYTKDEFQDLCELLTVETLEEQYEKTKRASICNLDCEIIVKKFQDKGLELVKETTSYYLEPYWGRDSIKSEALKKWCDGKDDELVELEAKLKEDGSI
jgi:hypothetical protein